MISFSHTNRDLKWNGQWVRNYAKARLSVKCWECGIPKLKHPDCKHSFCVTSKGPHHWHLKLRSREFIEGITLRCNVSGKPAGAEDKHWIQMCMSGKAECLAVQRSTCCWASLQRRYAARATASIYWWGASVSLMPETFRPWLALPASPVPEAINIVDIV